MSHNRCFKDFDLKFSSSNRWRKQRIKENIHGATDMKMCPQNK